MFKEIKKCRICGNAELVPVLDLGKQVLTGVFPKSKAQSVPAGPLELVKCQEDDENQFCGLVQLKHSCALDEMYGDNYGYRSGLNQSMVRHLQNKVSKILEFIQLMPGDLIIDIGSNDGTLLSSYPEVGCELVGIDPTGKKFKQYYPAHVRLIPDFFSAQAVKNNYGPKKAKVITSIAMFYDLESPMDFVEQVKDILADDGIWCCEQSYLPTMLGMNSYDTVCHEHLEYYRLKQIKWMADKIGLKIIDIEFNSINGGSFSVIMAKAKSPYKENANLVGGILKEEAGKGLRTLKPYSEFSQKVFQHRDQLKKYISAANKKEQKVFGYGASTKGNVILQYCGFTEQDLPFIAEVNKDKYGCFTPGTLIPIISEAEALSLRPDCLMVLPWHFRDFIVKKEATYLKNGGKLLFPLPVLEVVA